MIDNNGLGEIMANHTAGNLPIRQMDQGDHERLLSQQDEKKRDTSQISENQQNERREELENTESQTRSERVELEKDQVPRTDEPAEKPAGEDGLRLEQNPGGFDIIA